MYECKEGLDTLVKVVEETGQLQKAQEDNRMKQKDVVSIAIVLREDFPPQTKIVEWQEKEQKLGSQLEKIMTYQEE